MWDKVKRKGVAPRPPFFTISDPLDRQKPGELQEKNGGGMVAASNAFSSEKGERGEGKKKRHEIALGRRKKICVTHIVSEQKSILVVTQMKRKQEH